jgi:hypothetical protein
MFSIYFKKSHDHVVLTLCVLQGRFFTFFSKNPANYVSILMHELEWKASSKCRESHFRGPRFQNFLGEYATEAPTNSRFSGLLNQNTRPAPGSAPLDWGQKYA